MRSRLVTWLFALLLLGMQQEAQWHAIAHLGDTLQRPHETGLQLPVADGPCAACALFAGGAAAIASGGPALHEPPAWFEAPRRATVSYAVASPTYYLSRAPPPPLL